MCCNKKCLFGELPDLAKVTYAVEMTLLPSP